MGRDKRGHVFISHTKADKKLADAWNKLLGDLLGDHVSVEYSSKKDAEGSPTAGENWFKWIADQVLECDVALVLLTPNSVNKPWIQWEGGAVYGAALAQASEREEDQRDKVLPLVYKLADEEVFSPFASTEYKRGEHREDVKNLARTLINEFFQGRVPARVYAAALEKLGEGTAVRDHAETVERALLDAPLTPTEPVVQEWIRRFDELKQQRRLSEVDHMHNWMNVAFGRVQGQGRPLDFRLHRLLGDLYLKAQNWRAARRQYDLARQLAPRDVLILRNLGKALLESEDLDECEDVLERIVDLDERAFVTNAENAALKARYLREVGDLAAACDLLDKALQSPANDDSYYLADLLGQYSLALPDEKRTKVAYKRALRILKRVKEKNIWALATEATAHLALGEAPAGLACLSEIRSLEPAPSTGELASVEKGLRRLALGLSEDQQLKAWLRELLGE